MKHSVTVGAQLLWSGRYGCNNGRYGCTIVMSHIEINKAVSQWLLTFNLCVSVTWPLTCAFHIPCTHTPEIIDMHRGMCDNIFTLLLYIPAMRIFIRLWKSVIWWLTNTSPFTPMAAMRRRYHGLTLIPAWISNYMPGKVWGEITYPFLNFNGCTVEV